MVCVFIPNALHAASAMNKINEKGLQRCRQALTQCVDVRSPLDGHKQRLLAKVLPGTQPEDFLRLLLRVQEITLHLHTCGGQGWEAQT